RNSGTIDVSGGNLTLTQSGTTPSFTNTGAVTIASGRNFSVSSGRFYQVGASVRGGTLSLSNATANFATDVSVDATPLALVGTTEIGRASCRERAGQPLTLDRVTTSKPLVHQRLGAVTAGSSALSGLLTATAGSTL